MQKNFTIRLNKKIRTGCILVDASETLINEYGTEYGTVWEIRKPSWLPDDWAFSLTRSMFEDSNDVWNQNRFRIK